MMQKYIESFIILKFIESETIRIQAASTLADLNPLEIEKKEDFFHNFRIWTKSKWKMVTKLRGSKKVSVWYATVPFKTNNTSPD